MALKQLFALTVFAKNGLLPAFFSSKKFKNIAVPLSIVCSLTIALWAPLVQSHSVNSLYDISYMITNWFRIAEGQLPYRDFILVHNPGSFLWGGLLFRLFGASYFVVISWMCFVNLISVFLISRVLERLNIHPLFRLILLPLSSCALPYSVVASPNYDADATFAILLSLLFLLSLIKSSRNTPSIWIFLGVVAVLPFTIKQNYGGAFLLSVVIALVLVRRFLSLTYFLLGSILSISLLAVVMLFNGMLHNWWTYSVLFAAKNRLGNPFSPLDNLIKHPNILEIGLTTLAFVLIYRNAIKSFNNHRIFAAILVVLNMPTAKFLGESLIRFLQQYSAEGDLL